jgi:hypothetical protein
MFGRISLPAANSALTVQLVSSSHLVLADDRGRQTGFDLTRQVRRGAIGHSDSGGSVRRERHCVPDSAQPPEWAAGVARGPGVQRRHPTPGDGRAPHLRESVDGADRIAARYDPDRALDVYDVGIDPESLRARLNGRDVRTLFHPYAGWREVPGVPLTSGVNRLDLVIKGGHRSQAADGASPSNVHGPRRLRNPSITTTCERFWHAPVVVIVASRQGVEPAGPASRLSGSVTLKIKAISAIAPAREGARALASDADSLPVARESLDCGLHGANAPADFAQVPPAFWDRCCCP